MGKTGLIRKPENDKGSTDYHPWLTSEVFGKSGKGTVTLLGTIRPSNSQFGEGIVLDVKVNGSMYSFTSTLTWPFHFFSECPNLLWSLE